MQSVGSDRLQESLSKGHQDVLSNQDIERKASGDLNFSQTVAKAQSEATGNALVKLAGAVVAL
jgi:hypothetical protein